MTIGFTRKLWSIEEYERMIKMGILSKDDRVELIKGEIVELAPIGVRHAACVVAFQDLFHASLRQSVTISVQNPVRLPDDSEPQPDIALLKGHRTLYNHRRPTAEDVILLVEVSDTTLATDKEVKLPVYAHAEIPQVWIVNLDADVIEIYSEPAGAVYTKVALGRRGQLLALPGGLPGEIAVDEVLA
jgi:Uma2 family endonuclease